MSDEKAKRMEEEEKKEVEAQPKKKEKLKKDKKTKNKGEKITAKGFFGAIWAGILFVLKILWKILKFFLKYVLFPFWYTGSLYVRTFKFLRVRSNDKLTKEDKNYLSIIPTLFFMTAVCIIIIYLLYILILYLDRNYNFFTEALETIQDENFWVAIGRWIASVAIWLYIYILAPIGRFIRDDIFGSFQNLFAEHQWIGTLVILAILVVGTGLLVLLINIIKKGKIFKAIKKFFIKIKDGIVKGHEAIKRFVLKYIVGEKYVETRTKNFFWINVLLQMLITFVFFIFSMWLVVYYYLVLGEWVQADIGRFASYASAILFAGVGIFATWFFNIVHGVSTSPPE